MNKKIYDLTNYTYDEISNLFGSNDLNIKTIEKELNVEIYLTGTDLTITGNNSSQALRVVETLLNQVALKKEIKVEDVVFFCNSLLEDENKPISFRDKHIVKTINGKLVYPKTAGQMNLINNLENNTITFVIGPAGTGKTYLTVAYAADLLKNNVIKKIILTRPAVEAGESLGFLPGDLKEKVDPYLQPLYDALYEMFGGEQVERLIEKKVIEIVPLAYMRGRTLSDAFIILDEAQNATNDQIKMFLTRLGFNSKMVINGDITQVDLKQKKFSGLSSSYEIVKDIDGLSLVTFTQKDVVRNPLVQKIIMAYEAAEK